MRSYLSRKKLGGAGVEYVVKNDVSNQYVNISNGFRHTTDTPEIYKTTIHMIGNSNIWGLFSEDKYTISSYLQRLLNESDKNKYKILTYACSYIQKRVKENLLNAVNSIAINNNDVIVVSDVFSDEFFKKCSDVQVGTINLKEIFNRPHNLGEVFVDAHHYNFKGNKHIANKIFTPLLDILKNTDNNTVHKKKSTPIQIPKKINLEYLNKNPDLLKYIEFLNSIKQDIKGSIGAIVMNCNPFTLGHQYLIEKAYSEVDFLYIFVVEEDKSYFKFEDRLTLVKEGTKHLESVKVIPSGKFIASAETFPEYFDKDSLITATINPSMDIEIFAQYIAPTLNINVCFGGTEPLCLITHQYNEFMKHIFPRYNIKVIICDRKEHNGTAISASKVRALLQDKNFDEIKKIVPETTYNYLKKGEYL